MSNHGRRGPPHGSRSSTSTGQLYVDLDVVVAYLKARIPGIVIARTRRGIDTKGRPFKPYSTDYAKRRLKAGRSPTPSLWLTGGMVGSFALRSAVKGIDSVALYFGPDASTSPQMRLGSGGAHHTGKRSPPHNLLGWYHQTGKGDLPKRKWMGLTSAEQDKLAKEIEKLSGVWKLRR